MKTDLIEAAMQHKFSKGSKTEAILSKKSIDQMELAIALKKTKAYKEDKELKASVDCVISEGVIPEKTEKEPEKKETSRNGEPRRR